MITVPRTQQALSNSTTYIDFLGLSLGLSRMTGESAAAFSSRLRRAAVYNRNASYVGLMDELTIQFGFSLTQPISISGPSDLSITVDLAGLHLVSPSASLVLTTPLATTDVDGFWVWRKLSDLVADVNQSGLATARLIRADGLAFQLVEQSNTVLVQKEAISGQVVPLAQKNFVPGSEIFNLPVGSYTATGSILNFATPLPAAVTITYRILLPQPFLLLASPIFLMGLFDPHFRNLATTSDGQLTYQAREMTYELLTKDGSYWAD